MDPVGKQGKISGNEYRVGSQKLLDNGGAKSGYDGGFNKKSGTRGGKFSTSWQGNSSPNPKHINQKSSKSYFNRWENITE